MKNPIFDIKIIIFVIIALPIIFIIFWNYVLYLDEDHVILATQISLIIDIIAFTIIGIAIYKKGESHKKIRFEHEMNNIHDEIKRIKNTFEEYCDFINSINPDQVCIERQDESEIQSISNCICDDLKKTLDSRDEILKITKYSRNILQSLDIIELEILSKLVQHIVKNLTTYTATEYLKFWLDFDVKNKSKIRDIVNNTDKIHKRINQEYGLDKFKPEIFT